MKSLLIRLEEDKYELIKKNKEKGGFKTWEEMLLSLANVDDETLKHLRKNRLIKNLLEIFDEARIVVENEHEKNALEMERVSIVQLLNGNKAKAKEFLKKALEELNIDE